MFQSCLPLWSGNPPGQGVVSLSLHPLCPAWYREGAECHFVGWVSKTVAGGSGSRHTRNLQTLPPPHHPPPHHSQSHQHDGSAQTTTGSLGRSSRSTNVTSLSRGSLSSSSEPCALKPPHKVSSLACCPPHQHGSLSYLDLPQLMSKLLCLGFNFFTCDIGTKILTSLPYDK